MAPAGFYLFANVNFVPGRYEEWQAAYDELATYVYGKEPTTLTYYFGIPFDYSHDISSTTLMFAFEGYGTRDDLYKTHFGSSAMGTFLQKVSPTMTTGLDLMHYAPVHGYLDKPGDQRECKVMQDTRIWCKSSAARQVLLERLGSVAKGLESNDDHQVYTFEVCKNEDVDDEVRIFSRFGNRASMESHLASRRMLDLWLASKEDIGRMESRGYIPNGKGWLHR